jgi:hypothetical protein
VIWVYAICDRPGAPPPSIEGVAGATVEAIRMQELAAVVSRHAEAPTEPAVDAMWAHERVVEALMDDRAVLPMRFGTTLEEDEALVEVLATRRGEFSKGLATVRGRVEVGVRAVVEDHPRPDHGKNEEIVGAADTPLSGREYLLGKLGNPAARGEGDALHAPLAARAVTSQRWPVRSGEVLRASYLVERDQVAEFVAAADRVGRGNPRAQLLCTGPWPPYSFVGDSAPKTVATGTSG